MPNCARPSAQPIVGLASNDQSWVWDRGQFDDRLERACLTIALSSNRLAPDLLSFEEPTFLRENPLRPNPVRIGFAHLCECRSIQCRQDTCVGQHRHHREPELPSFLGQVGRRVHALDLRDVHRARLGADNNCVRFGSWSCQNAVGLRRTMSAGTKIRVSRVSPPHLLLMILTAAERPFRAPLGSIELAIGLSRGPDRGNQRCRPTMFITRVRL